jgi:hypothetical protein
MADESSSSLSRGMRPRVSFSSGESVFDEDGNTTIDTGEDDLEPKSLFSGRWIGDISTSDASRGVALVELNDNAPLGLPFQCSEQHHRSKRLSRDTNVSIEKFQGRHFESPPKSIHGDRSEVVSPLSKSSVTPPSESSHRSRFSSSSQGLNDDDDDSEVPTTRSGYSSHSLDYSGHSLNSGPSIAKSCKLRTRTVNRMRAVICFVGYATVVSRSCGNRFVLGSKLMGAFVPCFLACVSTTKDRQRTRLSEIACSRKTFLLLIYIATWTYIVNAAAGVWGDNTSCIENETTDARRKPFDEILAQNTPRIETDISVAIADLKKAADGQFEIETIDPEIAHISELLDDQVAEVDVVGFNEVEAMSEDTQTVAQESADREVEIETTRPEITHLLGSVNGEVAKVDAVEFIDAEATSEDILAEAQESADRELKTETISPEIARVSGSLDDEVAEVDAVERNDVEATHEDIQMEAQEAADREVEVETISSVITRVSVSLEDEMAEVDAVELNNAEATHEDIQMEAQEAADREVEIEAISPEITRVSGSLDDEVAEVDAVELNDVEAKSEDNMKAEEAADREVEIEAISPEITRVSGSLDDEVAEVDAVELNDVEAKSEDIQMEAEEASDCEVEIETISPEITRVSGSLDDEVAKVDAVELNDVEAKSEDIKMEAQEIRDREVEIEKISPEITRVSGSLDNEVAEVDAVELNDVEAKSEDIQMEAEEAADREVEIETISPEITRVSGSLDDKMAEVEDAVGRNAAEAKSEDTQTESQESADRYTEIEKITHVSGSLDIDKAEVDAVEFNVAEALSEDIQMEAQESIISSHFEKEISDLNTIQNKVTTAADAEVEIITRGTAHASEPQISLLIAEERHVVNDAGRFESQTVNIETVSPGSGRESNVMNTGIDEAEPRISPVINEKEAIVVEFGNATVATGLKEDTDNSYSANESTFGEDEPSHAASTIATETASESEANGEDNDLDTDSPNEVTNADIEDSCLDVDEMNTTENDYINPASEGTSGESEALRKAEATIDQLHGRKPLPSFITPFVTTSWMKDPVTTKQTPRFANNLFSVQIWQGLHPNRSGDGTAVNKHVHSVALTALTGAAKSAVKHCTAFLIGVDGNYKNQAMMDTLFEIWTSKFWI